MKILLNGQIIDIEESVEAMKQALIQMEANELMDIGCDGLEADEMAHEKFDFESEEIIKKQIHQLEIK